MTLTIYHAYLIFFYLFLKRQKDGQGRKTDAALTLDNTKYTLKSEIQSGNISPMIHIISTCPAGKTELLSKFNKIGDREYTGNFH